MQADPDAASNPDGKRQRSKEITDEKREKFRAKNGSLQNTSTDLKELTCDFKNQASAPIIRERLSQTNKARREASQNEFMEMNGMLDMVKGLEEVDYSKNCLRAQPGFVKPIQNGLRKEQNLI